MSGLGWVKQLVCLFLCQPNLEEADVGRDDALNHIGELPLEVEKFKSRIVREKAPKKVQFHDGLN